MSTARQCPLPGPATPADISNRPGLASIRYRVGTYASFRRAMLEAISATRIEVGGKKLRPLGLWTARTPDDYGIALLEMWSYLADILTFYQERIANEVFLRTTSRRESVLRLAALLDYQLGPGVAATADLAFTVEKNKQVKIRIGLRVQSTPGQDEKPQKFETVEAVTAFADLNEIGLRTTQPYTLVKGDKQAIVKGTTTGLKVGDFILDVGKEREEDAGSERWDVRRLSGVKVDPERQTTTITWEEGLGNKWPPISPPTEPQLFVFRLQAWPFGHNAPDWDLLPKELKKDPDATLKLDGPFENWNKKHLPEDSDHLDRIFLDNIYPPIHSGSWIALVSVKPPPVKGMENYPGYVELYRVLEVAETVRVAYTLTSKVTRLTVDVPKGKTQPEHIDYFPLRGTSILAQSEPLEIAEAPIESPVEGNILVLDGYYPLLQTGRRLLLKGEQADKPGELATEAVDIESVSHNARLTETSITLKSALTRAYKVDTVRLCGNAAKATHGETVAREVLGNGDASDAFQTFSVAKSPVTFVPRPGAPRGAASTLEVRVGGVRWHEDRTLFGYAADDHIYTTRIDNDAVMTVQFGDGGTGARLPTGRDNIVAKYRQGLGRQGNVPARSLNIPLDHPVGLKSVANPAKTEGGTDPESLEEARVNAPNTVRTFGRIVSLRDFEDAAREFAGVAKARAAWEWIGEEQAVRLTVAGDQGAEIPLGSETYKNLVAELNSRRDPHRTLRVQSYTPIYVQIRAAIQTHADYVTEEVQGAAKDALLAYFAFDAMELGRPIHLSDINRLLQDVAGVVSVDIDLLQFKRIEDRVPHGATDSAVQERLRILPNELARIKAPENDAVITIVSAQA